MPSDDHPGPRNSSSGWLSHVRVAAALLTLLALLTLGLSLAHHSLSNLDIWLHATAGDQILSGQGIPRTNDYSFTAPDHVWVDHEWLFQALVTLVAGAENGPDKADPWNLLRVILVGVLLATLLLGDGIFPVNVPARHRRLLLLAPVALVTLGMIWTRFILRPELLSYLGFILAMRWIDQATAVPPAPRYRSFVNSWLSVRSPGGRTIWLTLIWVQFHGFYILVPALWILATLLSPLNRRFQRRERKVPRRLASNAGRRDTSWGVWLACAATCFAVSILTPNGLAGLIYPFRALAQFSQVHVDFRQVISELAPLLSATDMLSTTIAIFKTSVVWACVWLVISCGRVSLLRIAVWAVALAAALHSQRNLGFYALSFYLLHAGYRRDYRLWWSAIPLPTIVQQTGTRLVRAAPLILVVSFVLTLVITAIWIPMIRSDRFYLAEGVGRRHGAGLTPAQYPFAAMAALRERSDGALPPTINNVNAAALLIFSEAGKVYIDGRTEAYPTSQWQEYLQLRRGGSQVAPILARWRPAAILLAHREESVHGLLETILADPAWRVESADPAGILFLPASVGSSRANEDIWAQAQTDLRNSLPPLPHASGGTTRAAGAVRAADACVAMAGLLNLARQDSAAHEIYRLGLSYYPHHPVLNHNYGNVFLAQGDYGKALGLFRRALQINSRLAKTRVNEGICLFRLGNFQAAESSFRTAVKIDPRRAEAWVNLAEVRRRRGDRDGALSAYERALALLPRDQRLRERVRAYRSGS